MRLGGEIHENVDAPLHRPLDVGLRGDVAFEEQVPGVPLQVLEVGGIAGVGELVEDGDPPVGVGGESVVDVVGADESGPPGDEDARHRIFAVSFSIIFSRTSWLARYSDSKVPASVHQPSRMSCCSSPRPR